MFEHAKTEALAFCLARWQTDASGELLAGGMPVTQAVEAAGGTPLYLYDRGIVARTVAEVREVLSGVELYYSIKANPFGPLVNLMASLVDGFDVASTNELHQAVNAGASGSAIQFSGPGKERAEIVQAVAARAVVNVESEVQLGYVAEAAESLGIAPGVVLRINPGEVAGSGGLSMAGAASQFGIELEAVPRAIACARKYGIEPLGFHFYWGTQCLDGARVAATQRECWRVTQELAATHDLPPTYLNLGGGFGIPYTRRDRPIDLAPVQDAILEIRDAFRATVDGARLIVELGRYLVGPAGIYVTRVVDMKRSGETTIIVTDGGMHQHLAASGGLGNALKNAFPCCAPATIEAPPTQTVRIVGKLCTPIDVLCREAQLPAIEPGDLVAIFQSGAYGASASPQGFLSHDSVRELLL